MTKMLSSYNYNFKKKLGVSCVDAVGGSYVMFNETSKDVVKAVVSSSSIPFVFPD